MALNGAIVRPARSPGTDRPGFIVRAVLLCSAPLMALMFTAVAPVLPGLMQAVGRSRDPALLAQLIMTMPSIGVIVGGAPAGWLAERFGPRTVLTAALLLYAFAGASGCVIVDADTFLMVRLLLGVAASAVATATLAIVGDLFDVDGRSRMLSYQGASGSAAGFVTLLLSGTLAEHFGWRAPFALYVVAIALFFAAVLALPSRAARVNPVEDSSPDHGARTAPTSLWPMWPVYVLVCVVFVGVFMNAVQTSLLLAADGLTSPQTMSWILATGALTSTAGALSYRWLTVRAGPRGTFSLALLLMGAGFVLLGGPGGVWVRVVAVGVASLGAGCTGPFIAALVLEKAPPAVRGRAAGLMYSTIYLGDFLNPLAMTPLRLAFGIHGAFVAAGGLCLLGSVVAMVWRWRGR